MPKACPYNLKDYIYTYAEQMHRVFGLTRNESLSYKIRTKWCIKTPNTDSYQH